MLKKTRLPQSFKSYLCSENITRTCITENKQHGKLSSHTSSFTFRLNKSTPLYILGCICWNCQKQILICFSWAVRLLTSSRKFLAWRWNFIYFWINCCCHHWLAYSKVPCLYLRRCVWQGYPRSNTESCLHWPVWSAATPSSWRKQWLRLLFFWTEGDQTASLSEWQHELPSLFICVAGLHNERVVGKKTNDKASLSPAERLLPSVANLLLSLNLKLLLWRHNESCRSWKEK